MRGTLFHEGKAYKLALNDLGRAILLNPEPSEPYFLRADCNSKLGNYEHAIDDLGSAEERNFPDVFSLLTLRATVYRILNRVPDAIADLKRAVKLLAPRGSSTMKTRYPESPVNELDIVSSDSLLVEANAFTAQDNDKVTKELPSVIVDDFTRIRVMSLLSLCLMDSKNFNEGFACLKSTFKVISDVHGDAVRKLELSPKKKAATNPLGMSPHLAKDRFRVKQIQRDTLVCFFHLVQSIVFDI
jgi:tetratricopeptide (TPR) repeat protein